MPATPQAIVELVERFHHNREHYHRADYNETQARVDFTDPLPLTKGQGDLDTDCRTM